MEFDTAGNTTDHEQEFAFTFPFFQRKAVEQSFPCRDTGQGHHGRLEPAPHVSLPWDDRCNANHSRGCPHAADSNHRYRSRQNCLQVHGVDESDEVVLVKQLRRNQVIPFFAKLEPCLVGMEACATAHHWARELTKLGLDVRMIPPVYVKAYVKRSKNDEADAAATCELPKAAK